jgi:signal peptidase II
MPPKLKVLLTATVAVLALDQATKIWVTSTLRLGIDEREVIPGFLSFIQAQNPGAAFGLMTDSPWRMWFFYGFTAVAVGILAQSYRTLAPDDRVNAGTVGLILGGALGNLVDRVHKQTVTDFIKVYTTWDPLEAPLVRQFGTAEWPTFNIADSAIVVGVAFYLLAGLVQKDPKAPADAAGSTPDLERE